ncbi:futalosine hydrolase [Paenibacillus beijingensis]|uniref:Futalosine hydrolase n=1 Tax=Paenibacillus beijingensis TaxID=1126833 RepID=A0A0D5NSE7_9BACL|nr:futalosine hydrolase [Paenibacillus beijingensis]AJY77932.1 hypothetical protein VN24_21955 [Paenibacillus beijingensis]
MLIMTAVEAEQNAVLRGLRGSDRFDVRIAGVGPAAAAARTAAALAGSRYDLVISAGIAGGFPGIAEIGSIVVADAIVAADLGAETPEGFTSVDKLGFGFSQIETDHLRLSRLAGALEAAGMSVHTGPVLTLSTVTGTSETAERLAALVPGAAAEAMEGFGVASAALLFGLPVLEIRTISNAIGPRDRSAWRIKEALEALEAASAVLTEVL